jgi:hypothetical protein
VAAWPALGAACCNDRQCKAPQHHHGATPQQPEAAMECGHAMAGMSACRMSCCHETERAVMTPTAFLLPGSVEIQAPTMFEAAKKNSNSVEIPCPFEPQSPPPRSA